MGYELLIVVVLVLVNGLFAGTELAILSLKATELSTARTGDRRVRAILALRAQPERFLATVQIGITVVGAAAAAFGGATLASDLTPLLIRVGFGDSADELAFALVIVFVSWLALVLGELVPKSLALRFSRRYAFAVALPVLMLSRIVRPFVWFLTACSNLVLRWFGDSTNFVESRASRQELRDLLEDAAKGGSVHPETSEIASRAIMFEEVAVAELMVPRANIVAITPRSTRAEVQHVLANSRHSRLPVHDPDIDDYVGYVIARDLVLHNAASEQVITDLPRHRALRAPRETRAVEVLRSMQQRRSQLVFVTHAGAVVGMVTLEDLIEELIGDVFSEDDQDEPLLEWSAAGTVDIPATAQVRRVNRELDVALPVGPEHTTLAGLCLLLHQSVPAVAQRLTADDGTIIEVLEALPRRVRTVRLHRHVPSVVE